MSNDMMTIDGERIFDLLAMQERIMRGNAAVAKERAALEAEEHARADAQRRLVIEMQRLTIEAEQRRIVEEA